MKSKPIYGVQTFVRDSKGNLAPGRFTTCKDADEARRIAEEKVDGAHADGAAAFFRTGAGEFDEGEVYAFATYGSVPRGVADALPF